MNDEPRRDDEPLPKLTFLQAMASAAAAAFGVQTRANRERDFARGRPMQFIAAGILFTAVFVLTIVFVVRFVLRNVS